MWAANYGMFWYIFLENFKIERLLQVNLFSIFGLSSKKAELKLLKSLLAIP
jgi:hypothetical protein